MQGEGEQIFGFFFKKALSVLLDLGGGVMLPNIEEVPEGYIVPLLANILAMLQPSKG